MTVLVADDHDINRKLLRTILKAEGYDVVEAADEAIRQGHERALLEGGELVVCHVIHDRLRHDPLFPQRSSSEMAQLVEAQQSAAKAVELRVVAVLGQQIRHGVTPVLETMLK